MFHAIIVILKSSSSIIRRINIDALYLPGKILLWSFRKNGTLIPELAEHDSGLNGTSISDKTERLSVY